MTTMEVTNNPAQVSVNIEMKPMIIKKLCQARMNNVVALPFMMKRDESHMFVSGGLLRIRLPATDW